MNIEMNAGDVVAAMLAAAVLHGRHDRSESAAAEAFFQMRREIAAKAAAGDASAAGEPQGH